MKGRLAVVIIVTGVALVAMLVIVKTPGPATSPEPREQVAVTAKPVEAPWAQPAVAPTTARAQARHELRPQSRAVDQPIALSTNRVERLASVRETFRSLGAGEAATALRSAKQLTNAVERETALLALATEWTHGELRSPEARAEAIARYGLEAGLGFELAKSPELALLWANELTDGQGRTALLGEVAAGMVGKDPAAAFALAEQVAEGDRRKFLDGVFSTWGGKDTEAALDWLNQVADPGEREADLRAIRSMAPVGIGTALAMKDGYPVINQVFPGTPAELTGQLHAGDRIVALAQGDNAFVDAHALALNDIVQMIRGAPGTTIQLQVLPANAPPDSLPQTVYIQRDQLKFKR